MTELSSNTVFYVSQKYTEDSSSPQYNPMQYNAMTRTYVTAGDYPYATPYQSKEEAQRRVSILNMLAALDEQSNSEMTYVVIKKSETLEIVE